MVLTIRLCPTIFKILPEHIDWTERFDGSVSKLQEEVASKKIAIPPEGVYIRSKSKSERDGVSVYYKVTFSPDPADKIREPRKLVGSWYQVFDERLQRAYFVNINTRKTQWKRPSLPPPLNQTGESLAVQSKGYVHESPRRTYSASSLLSNRAELSPVERELYKHIQDLQRQVQALNLHIRRQEKAAPAPIRAKKSLLASVENKVKQLVSKKKRRLQEDSFDLDLSYITGNVISMGYPATGVEGIYRNKITDVKKFLDERHYGKYRLYNLCSERIYDHSLFEGRVNHDFRFIDHHPPPMKHFAPFVASVTRWLHAAPKNVAVVHCKAGKGRTGTLISAYLCFSNEMSADEALDFFGRQRTTNGKGVTIPSQRRFVRYFSRLCEMQWQELRTKTARAASIKGLDASLLVMQHVGVRLRSVKLSSIPNMENGCKPYFEIHTDFTDNYWRGSKKSTECRVLTSSKPLGFKSTFRKREPGALIYYDLEAQKLLLEGEVKIIFKHKSVIGSQKVKMFHLWLHTAFIDKEELVFKRSELDGPHKGKTALKFDENFTLTLRFDLSTRNSPVFAGAAAPVKSTAAMASATMPAAAAAAAAAYTLPKTAPQPKLSSASTNKNGSNKSKSPRESAEEKSERSIPPKMALTSPEDDFSLPPPSPSPPPSQHSDSSDSSDSSDDSSDSSSESSSPIPPASPSPNYRHQSASPSSLSASDSASPPPMIDSPPPPPTKSKIKRGKK